MTRTVPRIIQFSYVVNDLDTAINHWARAMQVGPFFAMNHVPYRRCLFRGEPTPLDMSVAIAYSGDIQIELVQQHNAAPSIFHEFLQQRGEGLQHVGAISADIDADLSHFAARSVRPVQEGEAENGTRFAYLDTDLVPGTMLELFQLPDKIRSAFDYMRAAAAKWDPETDPPRAGGGRSGKS